MSHAVSTHDVEDCCHPDCGYCHSEDDAASPVSEEEMIQEELRDKAERRRKFRVARVISPRLPMGRHSLNYDTLLPAPGRRNREIDDGGLDW